MENFKIAFIILKTIRITIINLTKCNMSNTFGFKNYRKFADHSLEKLCIWPWPRSFLPWLRKSLSSKSRCLGLASDFFETLTLASDFFETLTLASDFFETLTLASDFFETLASNVVSSTPPLLVQPKTMLQKMQH